MSNTDDTRARIDRLIAAADRVAQRPVPTRAPRRWVPVAAITVAGVAVAAIIWSIASSSGDTIIVAQTTAVPTVPPGGAPTSLPVVITVSPTSAVQPTTTAPVIAPSTTQAAVVTPTTGPVATVVFVRWVTYENGSFRLQGHVPDLATSSALATSFSAAAGAANVRNEYLVRAGTPLPDAEPLYAHDALQFPTGSSSLQPPAVAFLETLATLLLQNPEVTVDVDAHTAAGPDPAADLALSQARADAVVDRLAALGVARERLTATGHGATRPVTDSPSAAGREANERVEFILHDLLPAG